MTFEELVKTITEKNITPKQMAREDYDPVGLPEHEMVEDFGGEDQGSTRYVVYHFKDPDIYIKISGYYTSYKGSDWSDAEFTEVKPKEKTITVYE